jgi:lipoprotein-anchoring transpeptidase ErfK/SrfK
MGEVAESRELAHCVDSVHPRMKRVLLILVSVCPILLIGAPAVAALRSHGVAAQQETAALLATHSVYSSPDGRVVAAVVARRPLTGERTVLPVLAQAIDNTVDRSGQLWLEVRLPGRANTGATPPPTGWISGSQTQLASTGWHIVIDLGARRVDIYLDGNQVRSYRAVIGKASTPTPPGEYFVEENVRMQPGAPGAPFALATSDRSQVLHEFEGGPGEIAIHGLENLGGTLGTAESHGCIRIANAAITWLAARITPGTPITIS